MNKDIIVCIFGLFLCTIPLFILFKYTDHIIEKMEYYKQKVFEYDKRINDVKIYMLNNTSKKNAEYGKNVWKILRGEDNVKD